MLLAVAVNEATPSASVQTSTCVEVKLGPLAGAMNCIGVAGTGTSMASVTRIFRGSGNALRIVAVCVVAESGFKMDGGPTGLASDTMLADNGIMKSRKTLMSLRAKFECDKALTSNV